MLRRCAMHSELWIATSFPTLWTSSLIPSTPLARRGGRPRINAAWTVAAGMLARISLHTFMPRRCAAMTVSMRKMSAGKGYEYLLRSVAAGDENRALTTPLTRYYAETGTPPGRWMGSGLGEFGQGQIVEDSVVTQSQLALLLG